MSKTAGTAASEFQTNSAAHRVRPATAGRTSTGSARIGPEEQISRKESRQTDGNYRLSLASQPDDRLCESSPGDDGHRVEYRLEPGPGDESYSDEAAPTGENRPDAGPENEAEPGDEHRPETGPEAEAEADGEAEDGEAEDGDSDDGEADGDSVVASRSVSDGPPSWSRVIATTLRLWLQRRLLGRQDVPGQRRKALRRRAGAFGVVILVFAAGALTIALAQHRTSSGPGDSGAGASNAPAAKPGTPALAQAAANRQNAAAWVATQVSNSVIVSCDPLMCADLEAHGFPVGDLMPLSASATDPMGSQIIVSTTALRNQFGTRLPDVYAPVVVASFGSGATRVDVRVDAPQGTQAYLVAQRADLLARQAAGQQLLHNKFLHVTGASRQDIAAGRVDSRLLITLAALTAQQQHQVYISRFGDAGPDQQSAPLRMVRIAALIPGQQGKPDTYLTAVLRFLRTQQAPFLGRITVLHRPAKTLVQIEFAAPSPLGLLGANATP